GCAGVASTNGNSLSPVLPTITTQPTNQAVTAGQTATFTVAAAGTAPLSYQWQKNGTSIAGATSANYTTPATTMSDNGVKFAVVVGDSAGTVTSTPGTLTVTDIVDRKSTRLNSSHGSISYAVFCLKKKKEKN